MLELIMGLLATGLFGCIGWLFINQSDVKAKAAVLEQKDSDLVYLIESKFTDVSNRLDRIERSLNGALLKH